MLDSTDKDARFVGSKGGAGVAQWLVSLMPPHSHYVEAFLGKGVVARTKLRAAYNIGIEEDADTLRKFWLGRDFDWLELINDDALAILPALQLPPTALVYCDPPYPDAVRADQGRRYYAKDKPDEAWHERFLTVATALRCMVMVSGYDNALYANALAGWRTSWKWTVNRSGARVKEFVWLNFEAPALLHDPRFVGGNYTDRQRVKRKVERWKNNFRAMPAGERWAIYDALSSVVDVEPCALLVKDAPQQVEFA